jgi:phosphoacetylglucosamine mutase
MLDPTWESHATALANSETTSEMIKSLIGLIAALSIDLAKPCSVIFGRDTRPSGEGLKEALVAGLEAMGAGEAELVDLGVVTTPCVHYAVKARNLKGEERKLYGEPTLEGYLGKMAGAFNKLMVRLAVVGSSGLTGTDV